MTDLLERLDLTLGDGYHVERELSGGGMSRVFVAEERTVGRRVVVKVLPPDLAGGELSVERFRREIQLAGRLHHPHIVPILSAGEAGGLLYYTMPFLEGESLAARLARERQLPIAEAVRLVSEVAGALDYAHRQGILHRDVKPANILLDDGHGVVSDFGIARAIAQAAGTTLTGSGLALGTPAYMSPEQAGGDGELDGRSDVYSLGCVLYEMLAGEPPFTGPTPQAVIAKRFAGPPPSVRVLRPGVPPVLEGVVLKALAMVPADRYQTAEAFRRALEAAGGEVGRASDAAVRATAAREATTRLLPSGEARLSRHRQRRWLAVGGLAAVLVAAAVGAATGVFRGERAASERVAGRVGGERTTGAPAAVLDPKRVVVAVPENRTGHPALDAVGQMAADYLARGLAETQLVEVIDARAELAGDSTRAAQGLSGARKLARELGAGSLLSGSYYQQGDSLRFEARVTDARSGRLIQSVAPAVGPAGEPSKAIELLRQRVMASFAARLDPRLADFATASQPPTYEAYQEFLAGEAAWFRDYGDEAVEDALRHYSRAAALDSSFTLPLVQIASIKSMIRGDGMDDCAHVDSIAELLRPRRERLPSHDRAVLDGSVASCHGDWVGALEAAREGLRAAPRSEPLALTAALLARRLNRLREALAILAPFDPERGDFKANLVLYNYVVNVATAYHLLGEHRRELAAVQQARRRYPNDMVLLDLEVIALAALGRVAEVNERLDERVQRPPDIGIWTDWVMSRAGAELRVHGYIEASKAVFERRLSWVRSRLAEEPPSANGRRMLAHALYEVGSYEEARPIYEELAAETAKDLTDQEARNKLRDLRADLGKLAARLGDRREAERIERWMAGLPRSPHDAWLATAYRAAIASELGDRERAVALLRLAINQGFSYFHMLHRWSSFDPLRDYPPFQELIRPKG